MGTASAYAACGCRQTRLMEPDIDIWIEWVRCGEHYRPEVDDARIVEAALNQRDYEAGQVKAIIERARADAARTAHWRITFATTTGPWDAQRVPTDAMNRIVRKAVADGVGVTVTWEPEDA